MQLPAESDNWTRHVTNLVIGGEVSADGIEAVVEAGLAGYALDRLSRGPGGAEAGSGLLEDARLRQGRLLAAARHVAVRRAAAELLGAWRAVGIESLLFKGFHLAEFVYPDPSWRRYSDVDVALRSVTGLAQDALAEAAAEAARAHGWQVVWRFGEADSVVSYHDPEYDGHELLQLRHEATGVSLDAHRRLVHSNVSRGGRSGKGEAITEAVWAAATPVALDGVEVSVPTAADAALVGLIAARSWSGDRHRLRPHDLLDLEALLAHGRIGRAELMTRASELGLTATARLFWRRCDPERRTIDLRAPTALEVFAYDSLLVGERGHRGLEQLSFSALRLPRKLYAVLGELPHVNARVRRWRAGLPLDWGEGAAARPTRERALDRRTWREAQYAVRRALQLHGLRPEDVPDLALTNLHASLTRRGFRLERRSSGDRHWFAHDGEALPFDVLGKPAAAAAGEGPAGWPLTPSRPAAKPLTTRLVDIGWGGALLRLEALYRLRQVVRRLQGAPFQAVQAAVAAARPAGRHEPVDAASVGRAVESAARFVPGAQCVAQSLAAQLMLARRGAASTLHFGFLRSEAGAVKGHAWLEVGGQVVTGDVGLEAFTRTATFEA